MSPACDTWNAASPLLAPIPHADERDEAGDERSRRRCSPGAADETGRLDDLVPDDELILVVDVGQCGARSSVPALRELADAGAAARGAQPEDRRGQAGAAMNSTITDSMTSTTSDGVLVLVRHDDAAGAEGAEQQPGEHRPDGVPRPSSATVIASKPKPGVDVLR